MMTDTQTPLSGPLTEATARERANEILGSDYEWHEMTGAIARAILRAFNEGAREVAQERDDLLTKLRAAADRIAELEALTRPEEASPDGQ